MNSQAKIQVVPKPDPVVPVSILSSSNTFMMSVEVHRLGKLYMPLRVKEICSFFLFRRLTGDWTEMITASYSTHTQHIGSAAIHIYKKQNKPKKKKQVDFNHIFKSSFSVWCPYHAFFFFSFFFSFSFQTCQQAHFPQWSCKKVQISRWNTELFQLKLILQRLINSKKK